MNANITLDDLYKEIREKENITLSSKRSFSHKKKTNGVSKRMSYGRIWFNLLLPDDFPLVDYPVTKNDLAKIIKEVSLKYDPDKCSEIIKNMQYHAFRLATIFPQSLKLDAFTLPEDIIKAKEKFQKNADKYDPVKFKEEAQKISKMIVSYMKKQKIPAQNIMEGGAGKDNPIAMWQALLVAKGYVMDIEGNVLGPIKTGITDGYGKVDYYNAAAEARGGFFYKSVLSHTPGYLSRKISMACAGIKISKIDDCKTNKYLEITITKDLKDKIIGRYYKNGSGLTKITLKNVDKIVGKKIKLRSPLYCKAKDGICSKCYGDLYKTLKTKEIGILAGGVINNVGIASMMKLRHKTSIVDIKKVDFIEDLKKLGSKITEFSPFLDIKKNEIYAKKLCTIIINREDYDDIPDMLIDAEDKYILPGIIEIIIGSEKKLDNTITLPFNYKVNLVKPSDLDVDGKIITLRYEPGELMIYAKYIENKIDPSVIDKLFEGRHKFLSTPETLLNSLREHLSTLDIVHLEVVISNMFRDKKDTTKPARLTDYKNYVIIGQKQIPFIDSWLSGLIFENINKSIENGLINKKTVQGNSIEQLYVKEFNKGSI